MPVPRGGGPVGSQQAKSGRFIPPLPAGIPILPGQADASKTRARRLPVGLVLVLVLAVLIAVSRLFVWYSEYDGKRIDPAVRQAIFAHATKGTRIPVTLWSGPRILQIEHAMVQFAPTVVGSGSFAHGPPTTCVGVSVLDPSTGAKDPKYQFGNLTCIEGIAYPISETPALPARLPERLRGQRKRTTR